MEGCRITRSTVTNANGLRVWTEHRQLTLLKTLDANYRWHPDDKLLVWLCGCGYFRPCDASGNQAALDGEPLLGL